jgi:hypothetical protein
MHLWRRIELITYYFLFLTVSHPMSYIRAAAYELPEMVELERIISENESRLSVRNVCEVDADGRRFPVYSLSLGSNSPRAPAIGFFGGVHGLERIGTHVLLAFLQSLLARMQWDHVLQWQLKSMRLVFMPLVNPAGMWKSTRSNPNGVDLMRNAPVESKEKVPFLLGGHRISCNLPWFRGPAAGLMENESQALCRIVREELLNHEFSIALDCHSGFGLRDRIWFPYACSTSPMNHLPEIQALEELFSQTYPNHNYVFEPQSRQYMTHGDLWDYLYLQVAEEKNRVFLPLTLEMGSWLWIKKNPRQLFSRNGFFNPLPAHRLQRVLRRHLVWLDFLTRAAWNCQQWLPEGMARAAQLERAHARWYGGVMQ